MATFARSAKTSSIKHYAGYNNLPNDKLVQLAEEGDATAALQLESNRQHFQANQAGNYVEIQMVGA